MALCLGLPHGKYVNQLIENFTYSHLVPLLGHWPPTRVLQLSLSWAFLSSWPQVSPSLLMSASKSNLHEFLGCPLSLFPCGFQARACLVMLAEGFQRVWPIHRQRLIMISASGYSLLMVICQRIHKILRRHERSRCSDRVASCTQFLQV